MNGYGFWCVAETCVAMDMNYHPIPSHWSHLIVAYCAALCMCPTHVAELQLHRILGGSNNHVLNRWVPRYFYSRWKNSKFHSYNDNYIWITCDFLSIVTAERWKLCKILAWKMQSPNFFPYFYAMIRGVMLNFWHVLRVFRLLHFAPVAIAFQPADRNSRTHHIAFYRNLCRLKWIRMRMLRVLMSLFDVGRLSYNLPVGKNTPCPMAWESQHDHLMDNDAIVPVSVELIGTNV